MTLNFGATLTSPIGLRDHIRGPVTAPATLVEYGDYECPHCGVAFMVVEHLRAQLGDRMCFVFRNFPLTQIHPHALPAAESAEAAGVVGRFWDMHNTLFQHQDALEDENLLQYASLLGMEPSVLADALTTHAFKSRVREDFTSGVRSGVNGTPTFFLNGARYEGPYDFEPMLMIIEQVAAPQPIRLRERF